MRPNTPHAVPVLPELRFRSDPGLGQMTGAYYDSLRQLLWHAFRIYWRNFWTMAAIFTLPVLPFDLLTATLLPGSLGFVIGFFPAMVAFSAIAIATSDVCNANRPGIRRSFRRLGGRRLAVVFTNALLVFLVICSVPVLISLGVTDATPSVVWSCALLLSVFVYVPLMIVLLVNVPIISAVEARPGFLRAMRRSIHLGRGHYLKVFILLCTLLTGVGVAWAISGIHESVAYIARYFFTPPFYIASVLLYYDLRARKEGYRSTELHEDII